ncbi:YdcF family protein [Virgibacillus dokdonensis]|uniref:YdcF family protein n=1 Tax=Virgibacillus dokdonensis TaxID=302167 RepID=UPI001C6E2A60|nr:YdcF family protein [Virgibacillus dokdonensis]
MLQARVNKATQLYHQGISKIVICSGGSVYNNCVEAEVMAKALKDLGVPSSNIICESKAKSTFHNLVYSQQIMQQENLTTAVIVSSPWHLRKASFYASRLGMYHTVEKTNLPKGFTLISVAVYIYMYTKMLLYHLRHGDLLKKRD